VHQAYGVTNKSSEQDQEYNTRCMKFISLPRSPDEINRFKPTDFPVIVCTLKPDHFSLIHKIRLVFWRAIAKKLISQIRSFLMYRYQNYMNGRIN